MKKNSCEMSKPLKQTTFLQDFVQMDPPVSTHLKHHSEFIPPTTNPTVRNSKNQEYNLHCFCSSTFPVFQMTRLLGINIISASHKCTRKTSISGPGHHDHQPISYCYSAGLFSLPSLCNIFFATGYIYFTIWIYLHLNEHLGVFFQGVDYYTLAVDIVSNFIQATSLLLNARFKGKMFIKALQEMQITFSCLKQQDSRFVLSNSLKIMSIGLVAFILTTTLIYGCLFLYLIFGLTIPYQSETNSNHDWSSVTFVMEKFGHFLLPLYSQSFAALFIVCTEIVCQLYVQMACQLKLSLNNSEYRMMGMESCTTSRIPNTRLLLSDEIESCRLLYERLFKTVGTLSNYFGGSLLAVCSIAVLSVTAAVYTVILHKADAGIVSNGQHQKEIVNFFFIVWGFHLFFSLFVLAGVLYSGQRVTCASRLISMVLQETSLKHADNESKFQINLLAQAIYGEPVEITACHITKMSMTFVASAVGNIITYILVLLQFRWSCN